MGYELRKEDGVLLSKPSSGEKWSYFGETGPLHWGGACMTDTPDPYDHSSPLNVRHGLVSRDAAPSITYATRPAPFMMVHNGHNVEVNASQAGQSANTVRALNDTFSLIQVHFHTPSEHWLAGQQYDFEAHIVHRSAASGKVLVLAILYQLAPLAPRAAAPLTDLITAMPLKVGDQRPPLLLSMHPLFSDALSRATATDAWRHYVGTLTTPPCTPGVEFFVSTAVQPISRNQLAAFNARVPFNARPLQEL